MLLLVRSCVVSRCQRPPVVMVCRGRVRWMARLRSVSKPYTYMQRASTLDGTTVQYHAHSHWHSCFAGSGLLTLSPDGSTAYLLCLDAAPGTASPAAVAANVAPARRVIARIKPSGAVDTSSYLNWSPFATSFPYRYIGS